MSTGTLPQNRRVFTRRPVNGKVNISCHRGSLDAPNLAISVGDISETGLRVVLKEALPKWQEVTIALVSPGAQRPTAVTGTVVWSEASDQGGYLVGVHLAKQLPYAEIQKMTC